MPFPKDEATPPVTKMYLVSPTVIIFFIGVCYTIQGAKVGKKWVSAYSLSRNIFLNALAGWEIKAIFAPINKETCRNYEFEQDFLHYLYAAGIIGWRLMCASCVG